ncbi:hypothetical protein AB0I37_24820 [Micromonospora purpureochromogenes]|uniref:hypothetical protein n=1 Tax=Micromonospora purpureochromogenes TaxID=47872 RepID=UPI0033E51B9E
MTGMIVGLLLGVPAGIVVGKAYARAQRAYRDLMATKKAIKGLFKRVVEQWVIAVKVGLGVGLVLALAFTAGLLAWLS